MRWDGMGALSQLYVWGCVANTAVFLVSDRERIRSNTVWHGFDAKVLAILVTLALQGLCVAAVVKHMSNVAKVRFPLTHPRTSSPPTRSKWSCLAVFS